MDTLRDLNNSVQTGICKLVALLLMFILFSIVFEVFGRGLLGVSQDWVIDLNRILFVWIVYLGAAVGFARGSHIRVEFLIEKVHGTTRKFVESVIQLATLIFLLVLANYGMEMAIIGRSNVFTTVKASYIWLYIPVCIFSILSLLFTALRIVEVWVGKEVKR